MTTTDTTSTWDRYWDGIGNEAWLAARALLELSLPLRRDAAQFIAPSRYNGVRDDDGTFHGHLELDWDAWVDDVERSGRGWSSTEHRLFRIVAGLVAGRPVHLAGVLDSMGSWQTETLRVLVEWATGGNNREHPGRATVVAR